MHTKSWEEWQYCISTAMGLSIKTMAEDDRSLMMIINLLSINILDSSVW